MFVEDVMLGAHVVGNKIRVAQFCNAKCECLASSVRPIRYDTASYALDVVLYPARPKVWKFANDAGQMLD